MAKAPGKVAGSLGNTKYYYTKDGKIVDEAGKPVSDRIAVLFEPGTASPEPKMEDVFPETFAGGKKQRKARSTVDADKESSEYKRNTQELRMTFENVEDLLRDNNVILKDQIVLQERSLVLLEEVVQAIKNKTGGSGGSNLPKVKNSFNLKSSYGKLGNIAKTMNIMAVMADINNFTKEDIEDKLNPPADDVMSQPMTKVIGDWWSGDKQDDAAGLQPKASISVAPGNDEGKTAEELVADMNARAASEASKSNKGGSKQTAAVADAGAAKVQSKNTLTFKGDELKFIADKLTFDVQTLKIESKTAPQQQQQQIGAPSVGAPTRATTGTGGANALGAGPGSVQSGNVTTPGGVAAPDRSRNLGSPNFTGNTGAGTNGPPFSNGKPPTGSQSDYYNSMYGSLLAAAKVKGVNNPEAIARLGAAQTSLETGYGKHMVGNNAFGIKADRDHPSVSAGTQEFVGGRMVGMKQNFRSYANVTDSAGDYIDFLMKNKRYKGVLGAGSAEEAITAQAKTGYATDPNYGAKLAAINAKFGGQAPPEVIKEALKEKTPESAATVAAAKAPEAIQVAAASATKSEPTAIKTAEKVWAKNSRGVEGQWVREGRFTSFVTRADIEAKETKAAEAKQQARYDVMEREDMRFGQEATARGNVAEMRRPVEKMVAAQQEAMKPKVPAAAIGIGAGAFGAYAPTSMAINPGREVAGERAKYQNASKNKSQKRLDHETPKTVSPGGDLMSSAANKHPYLPIAAAMGLLAAAVGVAAMRGHR